MLEQKVWTTTSSPLYPNLYTFIVGDAGTGKTRTIMKSKEFLTEIKDLKLGPTSVTMAHLVDLMSEAKRTIIRLHHGEPALEYHSMHLQCDELSAFLNDYNNELIPGLTTFYDCVPYAQGRRVGNIRIKIPNPQLNILSGTTPSNLIRFIPEYAWEQGFTSRIIMIYSEDRPIIDVFNTPSRAKPPEMLHDLRTIDSLVGEFTWSKGWADAMHNWKIEGYPDVPSHPKLEHYCSRRFAHLLKLCMVASVDRCNDLHLDVQDFNRAMGWLLEAEHFMPGIFKGGIGGADAKAIDEILHYIKSAQGENSVEEHRIVNFARQHIVYANNVINVLNLMEKSGLIYAVSIDKTTDLRNFRAY